MLITAIKVGVSKTGFYSRDVEPAKANERIYDEVKDGHEEENQQSVQHLVKKGGEPHR